MSEIKKTCSKCGIEKELNFFHKCKNNKCGVRARCKECRSEDNEINKEKNSKKKKIYYLKNSEYVKTHVKEYCKNNKEKVEER